MCSTGPQPCIEIDSAVAEAALEEARAATEAAFQEAHDISRAAFSAAINATAPEEIEEGSDEEYWSWRFDQVMSAWETHRDAMFDAYETSQDERVEALDALAEMFGHGAAPAPEPSAAPAAEPLVTA